MKRSGCALLAFLMVTTVRADVVHLKSGGTLRGVILQEDAESVTLAMDYGTMKLERGQISSIEKSTQKEAAPVVPPSAGSRLPHWSHVLGKIAEQEWAAGLEQIPATVIDKGVFARVPYMSYRFAGDWELNIYGDPDSPAGVEIGLYRERLCDEQAQKRCVEFIANVLLDPTDAALVRGVRLDQDEVVRGSLVIEVTPPTAEDAYGGWWVSVYDKKLLDRARASQEELVAITTTTAATESTPEGPGSVNLGWSAKELQKARPARQPTARAAPRPSGPTARPAEPARSDPVAGPAGSSHSSGPVYVRGYYRKDGTYVRGHTRSRPRR